MRRFKFLTIHRPAGCQHRLDDLTITAVVPGDGKPYASVECTCGYRCTVGARVTLRVEHGGGRAVSIREHSVGLPVLVR